MVTSLLKDVLSFAWRHRLFLLMHIGPLLLLLVVLFEMSGVNSIFLDAMNQMAEHEGSEETTPSTIEVESLSGGSIFLFLAYVLGSVYPSALVIHYVRSVFAGDSPSGRKLHSLAPALWMQMIGLYIIVWGGLLLLSSSVYGLFAALGLAQSAFGQVMVTALFGVFIYIHHRLSLAPYFCAHSRVSIITALKLSWSKAHGSVFILILGHFLLYLGVLILVSIIGQLLQSFFPENLIGGVQIFISVLAGFGGVLQTIYVYRVFSLLTEESPSQK